MSVMELKQLREICTAIEMQPRPPSREPREDRTRNAVGYATETS